MSTDNAQVALLITGKTISEVQVQVTLSVHWSHLYYAGIHDTAIRAGRAETSTMPIVIYGNPSSGRPSLTW